MRIARTSRLEPWRKKRTTGSETTPRRRIKALY
jgi:hypothetical protein